MIYTIYYKLNENGKENAIKVEARNTDEAINKACAIINENILITDCERD